MVKIFLYFWVSFFILLITLLSQVLPVLLYKFIYRSASIIIIFPGFFSSIKTLRLCFEILLLIIWFVSSKFCLCRRLITLSKTCFLFLGGLGLSLFLTKESLESCELLLLSISSEKKWNILYLFSFQVCLVSERL